MTPSGCLRIITYQIAFQPQLLPQLAETTRVKLLNASAQLRNMAPEKFKAIIIGGGPAGLTAAHILYKAGIDFVVLEARDKVAVDRGAAMVLGPQNLRVIRQLGLYDKLLEIGAELLSVKGFLQDGRVFKDVPELETFKEK